VGTGPGRGANLNFLLPRRCDEGRYRETLAEALAAVRRFAPAYLVVSLGTDIPAEDPVGGMQMSVSGFGRLGEEVRALDLPTLVVQEGGYPVEAIGECVAAFLAPWAESGR
jgi:acetoin utilization deacetylase AcuC-like enzyme